MFCHSIDNVSQTKIAAAKKIINARTISREGSAEGTARKGTLIRPKTFVS